MNFSTDSSLKFLVGFMFLGILTLSSFILSPSAKDHGETVITTKGFGEFIAKNPQLVIAIPEASRSLEQSTENTAPSQALSKIELSPEQLQVLKDAINDWRRGDVEGFDESNSKPPAHDARWRGRVESILDLAEKTASLEALDFLKAQIIFGYYDPDAQNKVYSKVWIERYLRVETRDYQRKQIQNLISE